MLVIFWILSRFKNLFSQDLKHIWQTKCPWKYTWVGLSLGVSIRYPCHLKKITLHWKIYIITEKKNTFASPQKSVIPTLWNSETKYNLAIICYKKCQFFGFPTSSYSFLIVFSLIYDFLPCPSFSSRMMLFRAALLSHNKTQKHNQNTW